MAHLNPRAVIAGRIRNRPPTALIVGIIITGVLLLITLVLYLILGGPVGTVVAILLTIPTGVVTAGLLLLLDRMEPEPPLKLLFAFLWGAGLAGLLALIINTAGMRFLFYPAFGAEIGHLVAAAIGAPVVEETLKGALLLLLLWRNRDEIDGVTDGILYAGMVGLGFALIEDVNYYVSTMAEGTPAVIMVVIMRGIVSPFCHPLFTAMTGLGVAYAALHRGPRGGLAVLAGLLGAMVLHFLWNASAAVLGLPGLLGAYLIMLWVMGGLAYLLIRDRRRIVRLLDRHLPTYAGVIGPEDVQMLGRLSSRRQARRRARLRLGPPAERALSDFQCAATELALLHDHAESGTVDPDRFRSRQQGLVAVMAAARQQFTPPPGLQPPPGGGPPPAPPTSTGRPPTVPQQRPPGPYGQQPPPQR